MYLVMGRILFIVFMILAVLSIISIFNKKYRNKKIYIGLASALILSIVCCNIDIKNKQVTKKPLTTTTTSNTVTKEDKPEINDSDKALLKKAYADFNDSEKLQFLDLEDKYNKLSDSMKAPFKTDVERLIKEKNAKLKEEASKRKVVGVTKDLGAGQFTVGKDIEKGIYDVTPAGGQGNFVINDSKGKLLTNEIIGDGDLGCKKVRIVISNGDVIKLSGINKTHFEPVTSDLIKDHVEAVLYSGYWSVGQDLGSGRYKVCENKSNSSNFVVYDKSGRLKANEIVSSSGDLGVKEYTIELSEGDLINISGSNGIKFVPQ